MKKLEKYTLFAEVFSYPTGQDQRFRENWQSLISPRAPELQALLEAFATHMQEKNLPQQQEYYISTFDVQALCYLDIGYVLYEEDYNRGRFLVYMKQEQEKAGNPRNSELPDHLPNVLNLLPLITDPTFAEELVVSMLIPALEKMIRSFQSDDNVYKGMLKVLQQTLEADFQNSAFERFEFSTLEKNRSFTCMSGCGSLI
ncbi:hypothetical protein INQ51_21690 [Maribellus sp. CM-23]|nr:hypothetical protein [Maribellus sp. CM-23]